MIKMTSEKNRSLEHEIWLGRGKDILRDYELLTYDDFIETWGLQNDK